MLRLYIVHFATVLLLASSIPQCAEASNHPQRRTPIQERLRAEHNHILDDLNSVDAQGTRLSWEDARTPGLLKRGWDLAGEWAADYIEMHPHASALELKNIFQGFAPEPKGVKSKYGDFLEYPNYCFTGSAISIGPAIHVVKATYFRDSSTGTFMVVARGGDGHLHALWNIKDVAIKHYAQQDEIGRWAHLVSRHYYNGPLDVSKLLPIYPAANGHPRFAVDAYQSADGGTILAQLSIWEWDGLEAQPLLLQVYQYAADYGSLQFDGKTLRIKTKEEPETFFSCGMCPEPRGIWTLRITPNGVQDLGHRFQKPEFQWADELLLRAQNREDAKDLATQSAIEAVQAQIRERQKEIDAEPKEPEEKHETEYYWGMLGGLRVFQRGKEGSFQLDLDEAQFTFKYVMRGTEPYFTDVQIK